jgi:DNA-binding NarL/FixJ family response regulator
MAYTWVSFVTVEITFTRNWRIGGHSPREEQTVHLVTEGLNNREVARELNLKENTVKKSLLRIYDKLGVSNRVELVLYALSHSQERLPEPERQEQSA